ncbi:hypothetical protein F5X71_34485 [Nocardia brasiliensis]|uniref:DUF6879 domain-containing protein n=1 Tax=Nocardia brasiliensis TaxID=37326 RepID=A0A6G9Y0T7_NOCBR|nr:DUF6879 family protein [Nocardia brasiliensis]QIS06736.1 hypothetical protein F5X71_34485 [Nocardia brasiliensis]
MQYLNVDETNTLIRTARSEAFHLEVSDDHSAVADETEPMRRVLAGLPPFEQDAYPDSWREWDELVMAVTGAGVAMRRVRVVTEPLTDYVRFLHALTDRNVALGEDIRWLPRHQVETADYTPDEWWLVDSSKVAFTIFATNGDFVGSAVTADPMIVDRCVSVRNHLWAKGIPHPEYGPVLQGG